MHLIFEIPTNKSANQAHEYLQGLIRIFTGPWEQRGSRGFRDGQHPLSATHLLMLYLFYVLTFPHIVNVHDKVPVTPHSSMNKLVFYPKSFFPMCHHHYCYRFLVKPGQPVRLMVSHHAHLVLHGFWRLIPYSQQCTHWFYLFICY